MKVNHMLQLEQLDRRDNPAPLSLAYWQEGAFADLGYVGSGPGGELRDGDLSFVNASWFADGKTDLVIVGTAPGNGPVATVIRSPEGLSTDDPWANLPPSRRVVTRFAIEGFSEEQYRNGLDVGVFHTQSPNLFDPGWQLYFRPMGALDGPVVTTMNVGDPESQRAVYVFGGEYRGRFTLESVDTDLDGRQELIAMPGVGGSPRVVVLDTETMSVRSSFYVGPVEDRSGRYTIAPASLGVQMRPLDYPGQTPVLGLTIESPDGSTLDWSFEGVSSNYWNEAYDEPWERAGGW